VEKSQKITLIEIAILFVAGFFPLLWFREGNILAFGDDFPLYLNAHKVFAAGPYLWSTDYLGYATPAPAYLLYQYLGAFLSTIGLSLSSIQITMKVFLFLVAGLSMFYLTKKIYPQHRLAAFIAGFFYLFNFFVLLDVNNVGFIWTYAFLPLLLGLFFTAITATYQKDKKAANKHIIYFALVSVVVFSFASINPANVALLLIGLAVFAFYFVFKYRKQMRPFLLSLGKIVGATFPINLWWLIPVLGSFIFSSSQTLNSQINIQSWDWTQNRSSFLNLFWLNGYWDWKPEYYPYANFYSNPILAILVFVPFTVAGVALLFKSNKSRFNAYIMAIILCFLFLAKGLHDPFRAQNLFLYNTVPFMSIFREPVSKFTLLLMPFLALLVGYGSENIANLKFHFSLQPLNRKSPQLPTRYKKRINFHHSKILVLALITIIFLVSVYPLIYNTTKITIEADSFSSSIQIPSYWYQATDWINKQQGNWRVLITPLDDFYQMPYKWGKDSSYYGTDQLIDRLIEKPIVSTDVLNSYVVNPQTASTLQELNYAMRYGRANEFRDLLDLLNIKYILQRNDVISNLPGRTTLPDGVLTSENAGAIMSPELMKDFFERQSYLHLAKTFGDLDIYEFTGSLQSFYALSPLSLNQSNIAIRATTTLQNEWNFTNEEDLSEWQSVAYDNANPTVSKPVQNGNFELSNTTGYYLKIESPYIQSLHENIYGIRFDSSGANTASMNVTVVQYDQNLTVLDNYVGKNLNYGNFTNFSSECRFEPLQETNYFKIQIWLDIWNSTDQIGLLQIADLNVTRSIYTLDTIGLDGLMNKTVQNQTVSILKVQNLNPTKTVLSVNATHPFILATSQAFDKSWSAIANGVQLKPVTLYLGLQGYEINKTGQLQITLEYKPQTWFYSASVISIASAIMLLVLVAYFSRERILQVVNKFKKN
jgi:hypothetical protein